MGEEKINQLKEELFARARKKFPGDEERQRAYVFSVIRKVKEHAK
jgi:hypothetical protein